MNSLIQLNGNKCFWNFFNLENNTILNLYNFLCCANVGFFFFSGGCLEDTYTIKLFDSSGNNQISLSSCYVNHIIWCEHTISVIKQVCSRTWNEQIFEHGLAYSTCTETVTNNIHIISLSLTSSFCSFPSLLS